MSHTLDELKWLRMHEFFCDCNKPKLLPEEKMLLQERSGGKVLAKDLVLKIRAC